MHVKLSSGIRDIKFGRAFIFIPTLGVQAVEALTRLHINQACLSLSFSSMW